MSAFYFLAIQGVLFIHSRKYRRVFVNSVLVIYSSITKCHQTVKINSHLLSVSENQESRSGLVGCVWFRVLHEVITVKLSARPVIAEDLTSLKDLFPKSCCVSWQASFSSSPYGPHHRATHNMAPTRAHGERERETHPRRKSRIFII